MARTQDQEYSWRDGLTQNESSHPCSAVWSRDTVCLGLTKYFTFWRSFDKIYEFLCAKKHAHAIQVRDLYSVGLVMLQFAAFYLVWKKSEVSKIWVYMGKSKYFDLGRFFYPLTSLSAPQSICAESASSQRIPHKKNEGKRTKSRCLKNPTSAQIWGKNDI